MREKRSRIQRGMVRVADDGDGEAMDGGSEGEDHEDLGMTRMHLSVPATKAKVELQVCITSIPPRCI
jgi:hypothetical protein